MIESLYELQADTHLDPRSRSAQVLWPSLRGLAVGDAVRVVPLEGVYQKERNGKVFRVTPSHALVQIEGGRSPVRFRLSDGMPVNKIDQVFPMYVIRKVLGESDPQVLAA